MYKQKSSFSFSRTAQLCLIYGFFAVLFQLTMILLCCLAAEEYLSPPIILYHFSPWLDYPLMSLVLLFAGAALLDLAGAP